MNITYTWKILDLYCIKDQRGLKNVVLGVRYECKGVADNGATAFIHEMAWLSAPTEGAFTKFTELTEETVYNWIYNLSPKRKAEEEVERYILEPEKYGEIILADKPWETATTSTIPQPPLDNQNF